MSTDKVLSSASASASAPLASPHVEVCKGVNGLDSSAETSTHGLGSFSPSRTVPPPSNVDGPYASLAERYPYFPTWKYKVMNPDGSFSFVNLVRPIYAQNVPRSGPIDVDLVEECMRMIADLQRVALDQSFQHSIKEFLLTTSLAIANARIKCFEERIRDFEFHEGQPGPQILANQEPQGHEEVGSSRGGPRRSSPRRTRGPNDA
ncbi:uncharacterized protein LOC112003174 [Quercus suber]|uniref:uncharacterized protein LOC112003174 n=1 Tax=Quercus suber TaxID=58331 RepID=UPI000CE19FB3|nr:uncharacterized protein LOC112003174 [Quercus suber]POE62297.1 hypothetical protein CFP56_71418 [Quercus suber]